jgi:hypothetical protein
MFFQNRKGSKIKHYYLVRQLSSFVTFVFFTMRIGSNSFACDVVNQTRSISSINHIKTGDGPILSNGPWQCKDARFTAGLGEYIKDVNYREISSWGARSNSVSYLSEGTNLYSDEELNSSMQSLANYSATVKNAQYKARIQESINSYYRAFNWLSTNRDTVIYHLCAQPRSQARTSNIEAEVTVTFKCLIVSPSQFVAPFIR